MNWYVGQKVVRVTEIRKATHCTLPCGAINKGDICVIMGFSQVRNHNQGELSLLITGKPVLLESGMDGGWKSSDFRPLQQLRDEARDEQQRKNPQHVS